MLQGIPRDHELGTFQVPMKFMQIDGQPKVTCVVGTREWRYPWLIIHPQMSPKATSEMTTMIVTSAGGVLDFLIWRFKRGKW